MQSFTLTRIIIIFFMIVHITQVINEAGVDNCGRGTFVWDDAPEHYCLHVYPKHTPWDNRFIEGYQDSCFRVDGVRFNWDLNNCDNDPITLESESEPVPTRRKSRKRRNTLSRKRRNIL
ncbi:2907_t:CDS:2 [Racocetra fulgida]|uniref:2907_t:CDS:1 n=1 Tax=Racocetra fulgida TaxID=60492 RepID=A0A9N9EUJ9_9GLOM|nr:2907_t:CDS:2 [Racocetra fulgida]